MILPNIVHHSAHSVGSGKDDIANVHQIGLFINNEY